MLAEHVIQYETNERLSCRFSRVSRPHDPPSRFYDRASASAAPLRLFDLTCGLFSVAVERALV
jgi:hypothetical protein